MSLYFETAPFLTPTNRSLKSRVFSAKPAKTSLNQIFALASEASKWSSVLAEVIERAQLLQHTQKLTPNLALLLVHDLLLNKRGISAPSNHPLRLAVEKHKARLAAELTRVRLKRGFTSIEQLRSHVEKEILQELPLTENDVIHNEKIPQPRWVRVNALKTVLQDQLTTTFSNHTVVETLDKIPCSANAPRVVHIDKHIPNLLALPPGTNLSKNKAYLDGLLILQDKASCFPAYLLDVDASDCCLDACAAPGNKTTHLSAILHEKCKQASSNTSKIHASERDPKRASILDAMVHKAGAAESVRTHRQDFLKFDPSKFPCSQVSALLLDPSCSGSGIVGRDETFSVTLPRIRDTLPSQISNKKKRKRTKLEPSASVVVAEADEETPPIDNTPERPLRERLTALSDFQLALLLHAFHFPKARKITYSTCSIYAEENENVVIKALIQSRAEGLGWRFLPRSEQVNGMQAWNIRGDVKACQTMLSGSSFVVDEIAEACIRCEKGTKEGTQGFFVAAFVRDRLPDVTDGVEEEEVWEGFDDT